VTSTEQARAAVERLVERFARNLDAYRRTDYKEAQVRAEFIDPFFEALGWDVRNVRGYAEQYKDVVHEASVKVGGATQAPDYCFRIGGTRKFFLEAKKPSVWVKGDVGPAYQLRRYAWSAKLPLSVLTDFEEFAVYDCRQRPRPTDKPGAARVMYLTFDEYLARWDEVYGVFAKEAVLQGSFDRYVQDAGAKRGTSEVDAEFLKEIEGWREALARNIARRNPALSVHELNHAVQHTIDRLIFLRMAEDRGIEEYGRLLALANLSPDPSPTRRGGTPPSLAGKGAGGLGYDRGGSIYARLVDTLYRPADEKYDAGLFDLQADALTPALIIDDRVLKPILAGLYYPESPYEFSVLPAEVLGQVYEQFLGKVIRLTPGHRAVVEEKPEVKKAGGVYYTPAYIVDYIVQQTVGRLVEGQTPREISKLRILDPACGSGSFLLGAYQYLLDYYLRWYVEHDPESHARGKHPTIYQTPLSLVGTTAPERSGGGRAGGEGSNWRLTTAEKKRILLTHIYGVDIAEKKRILLTHIYGVDIDRQAVEVTKLSLLLKVLEGESQETLGQQLALWRERALPDLADNIKCGNSLIGPDYYAAQLLPDEDELRRVNPFDWAAEFPEIMTAGGFDVVIGNPPWGAEFGEVERTYLVEHYPKVPTKTKDSFFYFITKALTLLRNDGRLGFIVPNTWLLINNAKEFRRDLLSLSVEEIVDYGDGVFKRATVESATLILCKSYSPDTNCRAVRIRKGEIVVDHVLSKQLWLDDEYVRIIIDMDDRKKRLLDKLRSQSELFEESCTIIWGIKPYQVGYGTPPQTREMVSKRIYHSTVAKGNEWKPLLVGSDVNRYTVIFPGSRYIKYGKWLMYPSNESLMMQPKILLRQTSDVLRAGYDEDMFFCQNSVFIIHSTEINLKYLLGLLNSRLLGFVYRLGNPQTGKVFAEIKPSVIKRLPIRTIDFDDPADAARHDRLVALVERMLALHRKLAAASIPADKKLYQRQIAATDQQIDALVYELYGLTAEEIAIVKT